MVADSIKTAMGATQSSTRIAALITQIVRFALHVTPPLQRAGDLARIPAFSRATLRGAASAHDPPTPARWCSAAHLA